MVELVDLELDKIVVDKGVRKTFDEEAIGKLSLSVAEHGVLQPILVEPREGGLYTLLIGGLRYRAAKRADLKTVPAIVFDKPLKEDKILEIRLIENIQRHALDPFDEAEAYQMLTEMGYSKAAIGRRVGKSRPYVVRRMRLLRLHPDLREAIRQGNLSPEHGQELLKLEDPSQQVALAEQIVKEGLSVKETRQRIREMQGREFKWRLVPVRLSLEEFSALQKMAPEGDVKKLIQETIAKLLQT